MKPTQKEIDEIKKAVRSDIAARSTLDKLLARYREIYFMTNIEKPKNSGVDSNDWKLTPSPAGRNSVIGMHRLLNTSDITIKIGDDVREADEIEEGLKTILRVSGEGGIGRVESDAALSAVLYGAVTVYAESIDDLLTIKSLPEYKRKHLEKKRKRSPFLLRLISTEESYPRFDEDMAIRHTWRYRIRGAELRNRWGVDTKDATEYVVYDVFTPEWHIVWADGLGDIFADAHGLGCLPVFTAYSGGTNLFNKPEEQNQSFLYAKAKGEMDKWENSLLTAIRTSIHRRGLLGAMYWIDPDNAPEKIQIDYQQGVLFAKGKVTAVNDKIIDPLVFQVQGLLADLNGTSTIQSATLGDNIGNLPFSSLAMLSNAGKLPLVDPTRALEHVFSAVFSHILYRIKSENITNELIDPAVLTDDVEVSVSLTAKLPQDSLRNAQVAQSLGDLVSDEWKHSELLQVGNSEEMQKQSMKEQMRKAVFAAILQNGQVINQAVAAIMGQGQQPAAQPNPQEMEQAQAEAQMQGQPNPEQLAQMMAQRGGMDMSGMGNMEAMPMTDSMPMPDEVMNGRG